MKTEQEQTKQMLKILCDKFQCSAIDRSYMAKSCKQCEAIVEALREAGYGDVTEYKAEIERLQSNTPQYLEDLLIEFDEMGFAPTTVCPNPDKYATEWRDRLVNCVNDATKQARTDVLNELKKKTHNYYPSIDSYCMSQHVVLVRDIDELIKEAEKQ